MTAITLAMSSACLALWLYAGAAIVNIAGVRLLAILPGFQLLSMRKTV